jgi:hypothetical protein
MAAERTAGGVPAVEMGTDAERRPMLAKVALRRARRLAMGDGHPAAGAGDRRWRSTQPQRSPGGGANDR